METRYCRHKILLGGKEELEPLATISPYDHLMTGSDGFGDLSSFESVKAESSVSFGNYSPMPVTYDNFEEINITPLLR
jgi:hypothetical protein